MASTQHSIEQLHEAVEALAIPPAPGDDPRIRLLDALEELQVADEELRQRNDDLINASEEVESERRRYRELFDSAPDAYVVTTDEGKIIEANRAAQTMLSVGSDGLHGRLLVTFAEGDHRRVLRTILTEVARNGAVSDRTVTMTDPEGVRRDTSVSVAVDPQTVPPRPLKWIFKDISERVRHEERLLRLNDELERRVEDRTTELRRAAAAKDEFLGMISHELRTPITTIYGNAQILRNRGDRINEHERIASIADIETEANRLQHLIEDLLILARLDVTKQTELEPVLPRRIISRTVEGFQRSCRREITQVYGDDVPPVHGDPTYIEQTLRNLISNAIKYSPGSTAIEVGAYRAGDAVEFFVADRGGGIPAPELEMIFSPFYRSGETSGRAPGAGVGLTVCKRLVEAQGGWIRASHRRGGGMEVRFAIPIEEGEA
jgi:PAS domain S-box-containing protein